MRSFLRGVVAGVVDELAWYALPVLVVAAGFAVVIDEGPDDAGPE